MIKLREYQRHAVGVAIERKRGIVEAPCSAGKTAMMAGVLLAAAPSMPWVILTHRKILRDQTASAFRKYGVLGVGRYGGSIDEHTRVTVATWQSLALRAKAGDPRALGLTAGAQGVMIDEVHISAANELRRLLERFAPIYCLGFSATPLLRADETENAWIANFFGGIIFTIEATDLVGAGVLPPPHIKMVPHEISRTPGALVTDSYSEYVVRSEDRNVRVAELAKAADKPVLVLVNRVEHGLRVMANLRALHAKAAFISADTPIEERVRILKQVGCGAVEVLCGSPVFDTGVDCPVLRSVVIAAGGRSAIACIQRQGRVMRPAPGKTHCTLWDLFDQGRPRLEESAHARIAAYRRLGFPIEVPSATAPSQDTRPAHRPRLAPQVSPSLQAGFSSPVPFTAASPRPCYRHEPLRESRQALLRRPNRPCTWNDVIDLLNFEEVALDRVFSWLFRRGWFVVPAGLIPLSLLGHCFGGP